MPKKSGPRTPIVPEANRPAVKPVAAAPARFSRLPASKPPPGAKPSITPKPGTAPADPEPPRRGPSFPVAGVGASAGGLEAFTALLKALPADTGIAFVLVQHMDPTHESILPKLLAKATRMPVHEVRDGMVVEPNHVSLIPPNRAMTISQGSLRLTSRRASPGWVELGRHGWARPPF